jgi:chemotaxis signal transduction protein
LVFRCGVSSPWLALAPGVIAEIPIDVRSSAVPNAPRALRGAINRRGDVFPVFDLARWMGWNEALAAMLLIEPGPHGAVLLIEGEPRVIDCRESGDAAPVSPVLAPFVNRRLASELGPVFELDHRRWFFAAGAESSAAPIGTA